MDVRSALTKTYDLFLKLEALEQYHSKLNGIPFKTLLVEDECINAKIFYEELKEKLNESKIILNQEKKLIRQKEELYKKEKIETIQTINLMIQDCNKQAKDFGKIIEEIPLEINCKTLVKKGKEIIDELTKQNKSIVVSEQPTIKKIKKSSEENLCQPQFDVIIEIKNKKKNKNFNNRNLESSNLSKRSKDNESFTVKMSEETKKKLINRCIKQFDPSFLAKKQEIILNFSELSVKNTLSHCLSQTIFFLFFFSEVL